jgi:pimeloyl-ACP methyl ester carboxylesterase
MKTATLLLVHSPLVGPSSWRPLGEVARGRGFDVIRPDLTGVADADAPQWQHLVDMSVRSAVGWSDLVVVGHSGAGAVLPAIAKRLGDRLRALVFVDAVVPPAEGEHRTPQSLLGLIDDKAVDGRLPKWLDWWPPEVVAELMPSSEHQAEIRADMPELNRSFYDDPIPMPPGWTTGPCAFLKLSTAYDDEYSHVSGLGWPRASIDGNHLSIFGDPAAVLDVIETLLDKVATVNVHRP